MNPQTGVNRLGTFLDANRGRLLHFIRRRLRDDGDRDAEDLLSDVVVRLLGRGEHLDGIEDVGAFVMRAIRNRIIDRYRAPRAALSLDTAADGGDWLIASRYDAHSQAEKRAIREAVQAAVDRLPEAQRTVWMAVELDGRPFSELAAAWGAPLNTLLSRKHRADKALRTALAGWR